MKRLSMLAWATVAATGLCHAQSHAPIVLPAVFGDHMVLQQNAPAAVWGWGNAGSTVKITGRDGPPAIR